MESIRQGESTGELNGYFSILNEQDELRISRLHVRHFVTTSYHNESKFKEKLIKIGN